MSEKILITDETEDGIIGKIVLALESGYRPVGGIIRLFWPVGDTGIIRSEYRQPMVRE